MRVFRNHGLLFTETRLPMELINLVLDYVVGPQKEWKERYKDVIGHLKIIQSPYHHLHFFYNAMTSDFVNRTDCFYYQYKIIEDEDDDLAIFENCDTTHCPVPQRKWMYSSLV